MRQQKGEFRDLAEDLLKQGFVRARVDGRKWFLLTEDLGLDRQMRHDIEVVVDRLVNGPSIRSRLAEAVELGLKVGQGQSNCRRYYQGEDESTDEIHEHKTFETSRLRR